jgi:hypothetical protein
MSRPNILTERAMERKLVECIKEELRKKEKWEKISIKSLAEKAGMDRETVRKKISKIEQKYKGELSELKTRYGDPPLILQKGCTPHEDELARKKAKETGFGAIGYYLFKRIAGNHPLLESIIASDPSDSILLRLQKRRLIPRIRRNWGME